MTFPLKQYRIAITLLRLSAVAGLGLFLASCSAERFLPNDEAQLLSSVKIKNDSKLPSPSSFRSYVVQEPNSRWFNLFKVPLGLYCLQTADSTRRFNRFVRRLGQAPVIYDHGLTQYSVQAIGNALRSQGFLHAAVSADTVSRKRRVKVTYRLRPGLPSYVDSIQYVFDNAAVRQVVMSDSAGCKLYKGMTLNTGILNNERSRIVNLLRNSGYYYVHREFVSFRADTLPDDYGVRLTLRVICPPDIDPDIAYQTYRIGHVTVRENLTDNEPTDSTAYDGIGILHQKKGLKIFRRVYSNHISIRPDSLYNAQSLQRTYAALNSLQAVNYSAIRFRDAANDTSALDCDISVQLNKPHTISAELEGTNTAGDLGAAVTLSYANRNVFRGAEALSLKLRSAYEAITGLEGYNNQNYLEYSGEIGLRFPSLLAPFVSRHAKRALNANSEVSLLYDSQNRPEFHRRVLTATWTYRWAPITDTRRQHRLDMLSLNYVFMPWISETFRQDYLDGSDPRYAVLRYSYENLFIMKLGYSFTYNSLKNAPTTGLYHTNGYQLRLSVETAGNVLYAASKLLHSKKNERGQYNLFNIAYSQYAKIDFDYAKSFIIDDRNSIALHTFFGIGIPYGNSTILPYEKRYFSGGANSVRGWSVRELGPGSYVGKDGKIDFINQTGNLKLDLSLEYRTHLFWKFHAAAFIDAGNIWNTRNYADQPGGQFKFDTFYRQIAVAYGLGVRFNLDYFVLRLDGGMKAINPAFESGIRHYPLIRPNLSRDFTFHFAVGLPF